MGLALLQLEQGHRSVLRPPLKPLESVDQSCSKTTTSSMRCHTLIAREFQSALCMPRALEPLDTLKWLATSQSTVPQRSLKKLASERYVVDNNDKAFNNFFLFFLQPIAIRFSTVGKIILWFGSLNNAVNELFAYSRWRERISWYCSRPSRFCHEILYWRWYLGFGWKQHSHLFHSWVDSQFK